MPCMWGHSGAGGLLMSCRHLGDALLGLCVELVAHDNHLHIDDAHLKMRYDLE